MAFTYVLTNDIGRIRFHVGDTREDEAAFTDEEITFALSEFGSIGLAVIRLLERRLAEIAALPSFSGGGISVNYQSALKALQMLIEEKRREFNIFDLPQGEVTIVDRSDSYGRGLGEEYLRLGIDPDTDRLNRDTYRRYD